MPSGLLNLALGVAMQVGSPGPSEMPGIPAPATAFGRYGSEGSSEQRYPFDSQQNFVHGYFQELPAYGGHHLFRPYNYKDVLSQSQTAAGWGERPNMPYSQQFWHKYHDQATLMKSTASAAPARAPQVWMPGTAQPTQSFAGWSPAPGSQIVVPPSTQFGTPAFPATPGSVYPAYGPISYPEPAPGSGLQPASGFQPASGYPMAPGIQSAADGVNPVSYRRY